MNKTDFIARFGTIFEHSPWIAGRAFDAGNLSGPLNAEIVHSGMVQIFRAAPEAERLGVLRAHPDLAGRLAIAGGLTSESRNEQAGAGLDRLRPTEHVRFTDLNTRYVAKFGFPFIIAVKGLDKADILAAFETRIHHGRQEEYETACREVEKIALLRLNALNAGDFND